MIVIGMEVVHVDLLLCRHLFVCTTLNASSARSGGINVVQSMLQIFGSLTC